MAEWDNGKLVCMRVSGLYCQADVAINGSFELATAREASINKHEWEPEPKLYNPTDPASQLENLPAASGKYD